jgi:hypothetical protein
VSQGRRWKSGRGLPQSKTLPHDSLNPKQLFGYSIFETALVLYAGIHRKVFGFHRLLSKRFPYGIYYQFNGQDVIVYRVLDCRQNPRKTRAALKFGS